MHISGGAGDTGSVNGGSVSARRFVALAYRPQEVRLDDQEFGTVGNGTIDFLLWRRPAPPWLKYWAPARPGSGHKQVADR